MKKLNIALALGLALSLIANGLLVWRDRQAPTLTDNTLAAFTGNILPAGQMLQMPISAYSDRASFEADVYGSPIAWTPYVEYPVVGRVIPLTSDTARELMASAPAVPATVEGIVRLLDWYAACQWNKCLQAVPGIDTPEARQSVKLFCNGLVSVFRTLLLSQGIVSRPVVFEFKDVYGGASHTFLEVWATDLKKWIYVDPFYKTYAPLSVGELVAAGNTERIVFRNLAPDERAVTDDQSRRREIAQTFREGWHLWSVYNGLTGTRSAYFYPETYGPDVSNHRPDNFGPFDQDMPY
ncbi:hypothetical protein JCM17960_10370 [Magnetospira thiophila]